MTIQKVLVVDDESGIRDMLKLALESADFECVEAGNIVDAHQKIVHDTPDIVLLDWMLPGGTGIELLRRLKRRRLLRFLQVLSSEAFSGVRERCM